MESIWFVQPVRGEGWTVQDQEARWLRMISSRKARERARKRRETCPRIDALEERRLLNYNLLGAQWSKPARVTFSIMPDGTDLGGVPSNLQATLDGNPNTAATWRNLIQKAAASWENFANVNLVQVSDNGAPLGTQGNQQNDSRFGDIRIGGYAQSPSQLAFAFAPPPFNGGTSAGDIFFNTSQSWNTNGNPYDFLSVALHEFGHALGMGHEDSQTTSVMWPTYTTAKNSLSSNDKDGDAAIYGPIPKDSFAQVGNGTLSTASDVTSYLDGNGQVALRGLTLTKSYEYHYFKVTVPSTTNGTMTVQTQATSLSSVIPAVRVFDGNNNFTGHASAGSTYSTTATVTMTGVQPGQVYKFQVYSPVTGAGAAGTYGFQINLGSAQQALLAPPDTTVAQQPDTNPGTYSQGTGWYSNGQFVPYLGEIGTLGSEYVPPGGNWRGRHRDRNPGGDDDGLVGLRFGSGALGFGDALMVFAFAPHEGRDFTQVASTSADNPTGLLFVNPGDNSLDLRGPALKKAWDSYDWSDDDAWSDLV